MDVEGMPLKQFFTEALRASFADLDIPERGALDYLADLLARYATTAELRPEATSGGRLETIGERLGEIQRCWDVSGPDFQPGREPALQRGIGDYALFMSGFFWESVRGASMARHYVRQGKRAYRFLGAYHRARSEREAIVYATLAGRFETFAAVLSYMRDVHLGAEFATWPHKAFARIS
jgi:hypothetical protein